MGILVALLLLISLAAAPPIAPLASIARAQEEPAPNEAQAAPAPSLADSLKSVLNLPRYKHAHWGLLVVDLETGKTLYRRNPDKLFAPASVTKLYTVAAGLDALGADFRFETPIYARGTRGEDGTLDGDLVLVASGDFSMGGRTDPSGRIAYTDSDHIYASFSGDSTLTRPNPLVGLDDLAQQVAGAGVRRVSGQVMIDDRLFESADGTGSGPSRLTPIMINDNLLDFVVSPTTAGQPAEFQWRPQTALFTVESQVQTVPKDGALSLFIRAHGDGRIELRGTIPEGTPPKLATYEVPDPARFSRALLIEALVRAGVTVDASPTAENPADALPPREEYEKLDCVAKLESPPFSESVKLILKVSHNLHASTLPLLIASKNGKRTLNDGMQLCRELYVKAGVDPEGISFGGGAGGARADYVTPRETVRLLKYMATRDDFAAYKSGLPILGVDGTLATVIPKDSPARGHAFAKTGTLVWYDAVNAKLLLTSKALAGYVTSASGRELAFAVFVNGVHLSEDVTAKTIGSDLGRVAEILYSVP
jgi:D-alanyl-D-alanine carboxypeptidase/D-alanyl-D-alanine-endopeptidase (penicillin-binding protein 4)